MNLTKAYDLLVEKITSWFEDFVRLLPNLVVAALVLVLGLFLARGAKKLASRLINKFSHFATLNNIIVSFIYVLFIGIVIFIVLSILNLDKAVTSILAGAGIVGLALAFAFQDLAANFISGILISIRRPLSVGDVVKLSGFMGKVEVINLRDTIIRDFNGQQIIIPNKDVFQNPIENYSSSGKRRLDLSVGVSYGDDLDKVRTVAVTALEKVSGRSMSDDIQLFFRDFGSSSIDFEVRIWLNSPEQSVYTLARSETIEFIKKAFDENDITIPFPIRTLDFGIKGGEKLSKMKVQG